MQLQTIALTNFRTFSQFSLDFTQPLTVVTGCNGSGKTSILEAISLLSTGKSFRAGKVAELVRLEQEWGQVAARLASNDELKVMVTSGFVQGRKAPPTVIKINQVNRRRSSLLGQLPSVVFRPEDLRLIEGSTNRRRNYLDEVLSQTSVSYTQAVKKYDQVLRKRNKLLQGIREGELPRSVLGYWTDHLLELGTVIQADRKKYIKFMGTVGFELDLAAEYDWSEVSRDRLEQYANREVAAGHTLVGPHKDDLALSFVLPATNSRQNLITFGSRGQHRLAVLWLKMVALKYLEEHLDHQPLLLLDDIFSELDDRSRGVVHQLLTKYQTVITSAEPHMNDQLQAENLNFQPVSLETT